MSYTDFLGLCVMFGIATAILARTVKELVLMIFIGLVIIEILKAYLWT